MQDAVVIFVKHFEQELYTRFHCPFHCRNVELFNELLERDPLHEYIVSEHVVEALVEEFDFVAEILFEVFLDGLLCQVDSTVVFFHRILANAPEEPLHFIVACQRDSYF